MANHTLTFTVLTFLVILVFASPAAAFGAGNIASIAKIEGKNWRHGDIEDTLATLLALKGGKWTAMNIRRVYFGNWLRDYSQALDVGTLKSVNKDTIRVLVWVLSFLGFGYATGEFEVTEERLGVYRPEEHIGKLSRHLEPPFRAKKCFRLFLYHKLLSKALIGSDLNITIFICPLSFMRYHLQC